jgi:hypothetical protein
MNLTVRSGQVWAGDGTDQQRSAVITTRINRGFVLGIG